MSPELQKLGRELAKELKGDPPRLIKTSRELLDALLAPKWRELPMQLGIPSTSQIFGQLVSQSGVEAISYPSKFSGRSCLAVYPQSFVGASSYLVLDGDPPRKDVTARLDRENWSSLCR